MHKEKRKGNIYFQHHKNSWLLNIVIITLIKTMDIIVKKIRSYWKKNENYEN